MRAKSEQIISEQQDALSHDASALISSHFEHIYLISAQPFSLSLCKHMSLIILHSHFFPLLCRLTLQTHLFTHSSSTIFSSSAFTSFCHCLSVSFSLTLQANISNHIHSHFQSLFIHFSLSLSLSLSLNSANTSLFPLFLHIFPPLHSSYNSYA
jgi:hypothetical protein